MRHVERPAPGAVATIGAIGGLISWLAMAGLMAAMLTVAGCSSGSNKSAGTPSPMYPGTGPLPKGGGRYHVGKPYEVAGQRYHPREEPDYDKVGIASWYGPGFHRRMTSNGEWFDQDYLSAAHPTLPLPSYARVTNLENGRNIVVRINDRGPFVDNRIIDLSKKSAEALGFHGRGTAKVRVKYLGPAPLDDEGTHLAAMNRQLKNGQPVLVAQKEDSRKAKADKAPQPVVAAMAPQPASLAAPSEGQRPGYYVQVGSFSDPSNAGRAKARVASLGPVVITPVDASLGRFYRVRVGPLPNEADAHAALVQVQAAGHHDARLVVAQN